MSRVLIVEDEVDIREGVSEYLSEVGYNVISAEDGMQAIELFKNSKIDLVILDIMLPKANGFVVLNKIRQESNVPVIMLTAMSDDYTQIMSFDEKDEENANKIVRRKQVELKPMDEEEAILQMELLGHDFYVFKNIDKDGKISVLYRRKNNDYGLIEEE